MAGLAEQLVETPPDRPSTQRPFYRAILLNASFAVIIVTPPTYVRGPPLLLPFELYLLSQPLWTTYAIEPLCS